MRDFATVGKNARLRDGSVQITSSREAFSVMTSSNPELALGASARDSDGLRRSQSTTIVRLPTWDISCATATATVDLPSFGRDEVKPMTRLALTTSFKSTASLMERMASVKRENGASTTAQCGLSSRIIVLGPNEFEALSGPGDSPAAGLSLSESDETKALVLPLADLNDPRRSETNTNEPIASPRRESSELAIVFGLLSST